ncbi:MAG: cobalt ECF transporter T component CbiQ [Leptolyngbyaceae cyanobacterium bins.302]|nr:cobalt ECF transporter T component CbiQ [Leptolyngbyaceae cyanobacterium bins.302]
MTLNLDIYIDRPSWLHTWEPRCKLIGLMGLIFAFAFVRDLWLLVPMVMVTTGLYFSSRLPLPFLLQRLRYPGFFLLGIVLLLPFFSGDTVIWQGGWVAVYQEGCEAVLLIAVRFLSIMTIALVLVGSTPFITLLNALRSLGLSPILTDMTLLTYRYLHDVVENLSTMRTAMQLRGGDRSQKRWFQLDWHFLTQMAMLTGTLLIRSYEQSERVYQSMRMRGYGLRRQTLAAAPSSMRKSTIALVGCLLLAIGFIFADRFELGWMVR